MVDPALTDPSLRVIADKLDDLARLVSRQAATLGGIADATATAAVGDLPLLVELHALRTDALTCAGTARSRRERAAFEAMAGGLERLMAGRGGTVVAPFPGDLFNATTMAAMEIIPTDDPALDRTVATLLEPGLQVCNRSVRPARAAVYRLR